jgi:hypothetical protein
VGARKGFGASCPEDSECGEGLACKSGECQTGDKEGPADESEETGKSCEMQSDCDAGQICNDNRQCEIPGGGRFKKNWITISIQQDVALMNSMSDACNLDTNNNSFYCIKGDGLQYIGYPVLKQEFEAQGTNPNGAVQGGFSVATTRLLIAYDRVFGKNVTAGLHVGYAFRGGAPSAAAIKSFFPVHIEARLGYWFGKNPFSKKGFHPFVFAMAGAAEVDASVGSKVTEDYAYIKQEHLTPDPAATEDSPTQSVTIWKKAGVGFVGAGIGGMYALSPKGGIVFALKAMEMFPVTTTIFSPEVGYMFGF